MPVTPRSQQPPMDDWASLTRVYRHELATCTDEVLPGPGRLRWGVPPSRRHDRRRRAPVLPGVRGDSSHSWGWGNRR